MLLDAGLEKPLTWYRVQTGDIKDMLTNWNIDLLQKKMYKHIYQWKFCVTRLICQHLKLSNFEGQVKEKGTLEKL